MRVHWGWVVLGFAAGAILWPRVAPKLSGMTKQGG